jgi:SpoVK/Ycf46/Vps4 family AAA+-type ATPase
MRTPERSLSPPGWRMVQDGMTRARRAFAAAPLPLKILAVAVLFVLSIPLATLLMVAGLVYAPYAVWAGRRSVAASLSVALWGVALVAGLAHKPSGSRDALLLLPLAVTGAAHAGTLGRWFAPCRTVAWTLGWALPIGIAMFRFLPHSEQFIGPAFAALIACVVLGWRLAKSWQDGRQYGRQQARGAALAAPHSWPPPRVPRGGGVPGMPRGGGPRGGGPVATADHPAGRHPSGNGRVTAAEAFRAGQAGDGPRSQPSAEAGRDGPAEQPEITVDEAMAELESMVGLTAVKDQIHSIAASIEAARRRALAGHGTDKPMQHFVFLGPPGTGKTAVARIVAKIFYAFGLLDTPAVIEAQRSDLVGEYLGATAIKTNALVDAALGGVLFIDEAYSLVNEGDGQGDRFGNEAVQALLKRAEDDRDDLVIILAGYERQMESLLATNPGLTSRFGIRVKFPGYAPAELLSLADLALERRGELLDPDARPVLWRMFEDVGRRRLADELGNGRFVRSLLERAGQARDVRVMGAAVEPSSADLVTVRGGDLEQAFSELTARYRGYGETPTLESALAELDALVGLEPVKRQVREIAAQLRVARLRDRQGLASQPPVRHFVFTGPPGTGKTTVARILGRIFSALGLLVRPSVVEAHRADLVGEHLGSTAVKTNKLIDSALGGVLFIDEAYSLHNDGYSGGDAFGSEAVAALLKRAEDDRDRLVIVLAGYTADMDRLLRSNPGLASRFGVRIAFPSYSPEQLTRIAESIAQQAGDSFDADALPVLEEIFSQACEQQRIDELGNGRFARSLFERACASRDVRVAHLGEDASAAQLTTIAASDLLAAYRAITG